MPDRSIPRGPLALPVDEPLAWFGGRLATDLVEVRHDVAALDEEGWWAVVATYEGALTLARFATVRQAALPPPGAGWPGLDGPWSSSLRQSDYLRACEKVRSRIGTGEVYQVNICRVLEHQIAQDVDLVALAHRLQSGNPAPHEGIVRVPGTQVVCASPELFLRREADTVITGPIKGTASIAGRMLAKDVAENVMIVDLARNDLSRVCRPGSVEVADLLALEQHPGLVHLVSRVRGRLRPHVAWQQLWAATTPAASVTGAPKSSALRAIADFEQGPRGPYCGVIGWVDGTNRTAELAVGIRTFWRCNDSAGRPVLRFGTGAGITWGSDPQAEWEETELKARRLVGLTASCAPTTQDGFGRLEP